MWEDLKELSHQVTEAWCILGDFNVVLFKEDKRGGNDVHDTEIREMIEFIKYGDLHEMRWNGPYYSWTNKTVWNRIDRALINIHWYEIFDFTHNQYLANGLSNHYPMLIHFLSSLKPKKTFLFCEMWCKHPDFQELVNSVIPSNIVTPLHQFRVVMNKLKVLLSKLHKDNYADLRAQHKLAKGELTRLQLLL